MFPVKKNCSDGMPPFQTDPSYGRLASTKSPLMKMIHGYGSRSFWPHSGAMKKLVFL